MKKRGRRLIELKQTFQVRVCARLAVQRHACAFGENPQRLAKFHVLLFHYECENIAARPACAKTMPRLGFWKHIERGRPRILMKRTKARVSASRAPQFDSLRNEVNDVELLLDLVYDRHSTSMNNEQ